jgi:formylglycine-generating enzyme required for sulfatase activity
MKKNIGLFLVCLLTVVFLQNISCNTTGTSVNGAVLLNNIISGTVILDEAIRLAAENIENNVEQGFRIALLNFDSPSDNFSEYVLERMTDRLVEGKKLLVVNRNELELIRQEEEFQMSGEVSEESAQSIGKKLGAQIIVSGSLTSLGSTYLFRIRVLNVETAATIVSSTSDLNPNEERIQYLLAGARHTVMDMSTSLKIDLVLVEGGTLELGCDCEMCVGYGNRNPVYTVELSNFYMGANEITQREWIALMGNNPSYFIGDNLPVENISWYDAIEFCNALSLLEGLTPTYTIYKDRIDLRNFNKEDNLKWTVVLNRGANGYRLPTSAEWEYAARGGKRSNGNWNNRDFNEAWIHDNSGGSTQEVKGLKPNVLGLYDMIGNVREWCWDWDRDFSYNYEKDPIGPDGGSYRVTRGGDIIWDGYGGGPWHIPVKTGFSPSNKISGLDLFEDSFVFMHPLIGFRVARNY